MKKALILFVILGLGAAGFLSGLVLNALYDKPEAKTSTPVRFIIDKGENFSAVLQRLSNAHLIEHAWIINTYAAFRGYDRNIHAGTYMLQPGDEAKSILHKLVSGDVFKAAVTIPEGFAVWEIAGAFRSAAGVDSSLFIAFCSNRENALAFGFDAPGMEGYLFPDTYNIPWGINIEDLARAMAGRFRVEFDDTMRDRARELQMRVGDIVTLASIIEAEAKLPIERPLISAVYHNRLKRRMKLEADPTVAYAMGGFRGRLRRKDLQTDSPYNTYIHYGLPPGPICSPGKQSLIAALYPDTTSRALYFVARGDGGHIFSMNLKNHLAAISRLKKRKTGSR